MFLESIKFYEHVDVLLKISDVITNVFEALGGNPALEHTVSCDKRTIATGFNKYFVEKMRKANMSQQRLPDGV